MMELVIGVLAGGVLALLGVLAGAHLTGWAPLRELRGKPEPEASEESSAEETRRSKEIDEGIQNLMTFSVNGKDGFEL